MRNEIFTRTQEGCIAEFSLLLSFQSGTYFKVFSDTLFLVLVCLGVFPCNVGRTCET